MCCIMYTLVFGPLVNLWRIECRLLNVMRRERKPLVIGSKKVGPKC